MYRGLTLDQAPPLEAPLKFFLAAPFFAIIAGVLVFISDFTLFSHDTQTIAFLHLLTIGFIIMIMFGALQQILPVVAGAVIYKPKLVANLTFSFLIIGIFAFFLGFFFYQKVFLYISALFLLLGLLFFTSIALYSLLKIKNRTPIVWSIILSLVFFMITYLLGVHLTISHATENILSSHYDLVNLHLNFAFLGWIFMLICGITFQVVPMFWVCDPFNIKTQKIIILGIVFSLIFLTIDTFFQLGLNLTYKCLICLIASFYAYQTMLKLNSRRRKLRDQSVIFWKISIYFLISAVIYMLAQIFYPLENEILAVLFGGFIISLINGMLYKIVPFLVWFHLSAKGIFEIPTMKEMINDSLVTFQRYFHLLFFITIIFGLLFDVSVLVKVSGLFLFISNLLLLNNLLSAVKIYKKNK